MVIANITGLVGRSTLESLDLTKLQYGVSHVEAFTPGSYYEEIEVTMG